MTAAPALAQIAQALGCATDCSSSKQVSQSSGNVALELLENIAKHVMEHIKQIDLEPLILLNLVCRHLEETMTSHFGEATESADVGDNEDDVLAALLTLTAVAQQAGLSDVAAVCSRIGHSDMNVRHAARELFCRIIENDAAVIEASRENHYRVGSAAVKQLLPHILNSDLELKLDALERIPQFVTRGDVDVIAAVSACLLDVDEGVRCEAIKALGQVVHKGDNIAIAAALRCSKDEHRYVRAAALDALGHLVETGDDVTIDAVTECFEDRDEFVRRAASRRLSQIADRGNHHVIITMRPRLKHDQEYVRCAALKMLGRFATPNDHATALAMMGCLQDDDEDVRQAAADAIAEFTAALHTLEHELAPQ